MKRQKKIPRYLKPTKHLLLNKMSRFLLAAAMLFSFSAFAGELPKTQQFEVISRSSPVDLSGEELEKTAYGDSEWAWGKTGYVASKYAIPLFDELGFRYSGGNYDNELIRFRLRCPQKLESGKKYPLVLWLHGAGEAGDDNKSQLAHVHYLLPFIAGEKQLDCFILAPQCPSDHSLWNTDSLWIPEDKRTPEDIMNIEDTPTRILEAIIDGLLEEFPIDTHKISAIGFCSGCFGIDMLIDDCPNLLSAAVYISRGARKDLKVIDRVPQYYFYGIADGTVDVKNLETYERLMLEAGGTMFIKKCETEPGDRHNSWKAALYRYRALQWALEQIRK
jgi:predicted peptidase